MKRLIALAALLLLPSAGMVDIVYGQTIDAPAASMAIRPPASSLSGPALEQLVAPIALYPDPLLGQILTASTYPLEVVEAQRWLVENGHSTLSGPTLADALTDEPWDNSVKGLLSFPDTLQMMNSQLQWTEQLGEAFLARQADLMDAIQSLRRRAESAGSLKSTPQETITANDTGIAIEPANPNVIYVPYYFPALAYGPWPWPDYPPYYFGMVPGIYFGDAMIGFGLGIGIYGPWWLGFGWDWHHHHLYPHRSPFPMNPWQHNPGHRHGVPYRDAGNAARFQEGSSEARRAARGFSLPEVSHRVPAPPQEQAPRGVDREPPTADYPRGTRPPSTTPRVEANHPPVATPRAAPERPPAPAYESFGRGHEVRSESNRGFSSSHPGSSPARPPGGGRPH
jgi:hypothetical protein